MELKVAPELKTGAFVTNVAFESVALLNVGVVVLKVAPALKTGAVLLKVAPASKVGATLLNDPPALNLAVPLKVVVPRTIRFVPTPTVPVVDRFPVIYWLPFTSN